MKTNKYIIFTSLLLISSLPLEVQAHTGIGSVNGLVNGLLHPLIGVDHLLVMLAIGLWATILDKTALWLLPTTFLIAMTFGALLSFNGLSFSTVENWVAFSVLVLGALVWRAISEKASRCDHSSGVASANFLGADKSGLVVEAVSDFSVLGNTNAWNNFRWP